MLLPEFREVRYANPPLKLVIAQVRFPIPEGGHHERAWAAFGHWLAAAYPSQEKGEPPSLLSQSPPQLAAPPEPVHRFYDASRQWAVVLEDGALTLEAHARAYSNSDSLLERFNQVLKAGQEALHIGRRLRLGLRYVNEIRHPDLLTLASCTQKDLLRKELVGFAATLTDDANAVDHMIQEIRFKEALGVFVVRHGLLRGASIAALPTAEEPASRSVPYYLLDLDYWDDKETELDPDQVQGQLRSFSTLSYRFFRWTLGRQLEDYMKPIDQEAGSP